MRSALARLSAIDADGAAALRIVAFFDALTGRDIHPMVLVRAASGLAECPAGFRQGSGSVHRAVPNSPSAADQPTATVSGRRTLPRGGFVWLERGTGPRSHDELILERMALVAGAISDPPRADEEVDRNSTLATSLSQRMAEGERLRALSDLGFDLEDRFVVVTLAGKRSVDQLLSSATLVAERSDGRAVAAPLDRDIVILFSAGATTSSIAQRLRSQFEHDPCLTTSHAGVGAQSSAAALPLSLATARVALRFARMPAPIGFGSQRVATYDDLGPVRLLAELPDERIRDDPDVVRLAALRSGPDGQERIDTLRAVCVAGSIRRAARALHLHHSTLAVRVERLEEEIGRDLGDPAQRLSVHLALIALELGE